jgi:hypothetical protein
MEPPKQEEDEASGVTPEVAARIFAAAGLSESSLSLEKLRSAILSAQPLTWKVGRGVAFRSGSLRDNPLQAARRAELAEVARSLSEHVRVPGLRLVTSLIWDRITGTPDEHIRAVLNHTGYQAAARTSVWDSGIASFVFDDAIVPDWRSSPALRWPLRIVAEASLFESLTNSRAMQRGFVRLRPSWAAFMDEPHVVAQVVEWIDEGFGGRKLVLRFVESGSPPPLPSQVRVRDIQGLGPTILLHTTGLEHADSLRASEVLSDFLDEAAHNLPVDVAAWEASRLKGAHAAPVVFAPRGFLRRSRLSDVAPGGRGPCLCVSCLLWLKRQDLFRMSNDQRRSLLECGARLMTRRAAGVESRFAFAAVVSSPCGEIRSLSSKRYVAQ